MATIICLANSWKYDERCIAGIDLETGQWVRPVCPLYPQDGRVSQGTRLIEGQEPAILDILEIPIEATGPDFGFECENRTIATGPWNRLGRAKPEQLLPYCDTLDFVLHNAERYVTVAEFQTLPFSERRTLQLVYTPKLKIQELPKAGGSKWRGSLTTTRGAQVIQASITDPVLVSKLEFGYEPQNPCLVTVSMSMPFRPDEEWDSDPCWKLIAGVIELSNYDLIMVEMRRLGWRIEQGRQFLKETYGKRSRQDLTDIELNDFLMQLKQL